MAKTFRICDYGCGQEAEYQLKNKKWCCSNFYQACPQIIEKMNIKRKGKVSPLKGKSLEEIHGIEKSIEIKNKIGKTLTGRVVSSKTKEKIRQVRKGKTLEEIYGKEKATFLKSKYSKARKGKTLEERCGREKARIIKEKQSIRMTGKNNPFYRKTHVKKTIEKLKKNTGEGGFFYGKLGVNHPNYLTISKIKRKYPIFSKIEEMRYDPNKPGEKEIQVHCKNHNCKNSKEQGGWFTPTKSQLQERKRQIESECGQGGCHFYCSQECKDECPLFGLHSDPFEVGNKEQFYTSAEYNTFKNHVLQRDNHECQICGEPAEHVHHERPQKLEPFFALDPDLAWSMCSKCHYEKGHPTGTECSTGGLAAKICK